MPRASTTGLSGFYATGEGKDRRYGINVRWKDPKSGQPQRYQYTFPIGTKRAEAKATAEKIISSCRAGTFDPKPKTTPTLGVVFDLYVEAMRAKNLRSIKSRVTHGKLFKKVLGEDRELGALTLEHVESVGVELSKASRSASTVNRHLTTLKHFMRWAGKHGHMPRALAIALREDASPMREPAGRVRWVREDERERFDALGGWLGTLVRAARLTGCRLSELVTMRGRQVDRKGGSITLVRTKSGKTRLVTISPLLASVMPADIGPDMYVFDVPKGEGKPGAKRTEDERRRDYTSLAFTRWAERVGIEDFTFHDLRHDFATSTRRKGAKLDTVASLLGHSTVVMASRYAHIGDSERDAAFRSVDVGLPLAVPPSPKPEPRKLRLVKGTGT